MACDNAGSMDIGSRDVVEHLFLPIKIIQNMQTEF